MSFHLFNLAWEYELRAPEKLVLVALAHRSVQSTRECTMTVSRLAFECGMSSSGARQQLAALIARGLVDELRDGRITHYRLNLTLRDLEVHGQA